jgi:hypothetical protein
MAAAMSLVAATFKSVGVANGAFCLRSRFSMCVADCFITMSFRLVCRWNIERYGPLHPHGKALQSGEAVLRFESSHPSGARAPKE